MRRLNREINIFSISAVDLFASALGAFILLLMLVFPSYKNGGNDNAHSKIQDIMEQRNLAASELADLLSNIEQSSNQLQELSEDNRGIEQRLSRQRTQLKDLKTQLADLLVAVPKPVEEAIPEEATEEPEELLASVDFSILGLVTQAKSFVIVIDMSGSMMAYSDLMIKTVLEILEPLDETNRLAIVGFQGDPSPVLWNYPSSDGLMQGTPENLRQAREFARGLASRFSGSTPTHAALMAAMQFKADAIILMSDGAPDENPNFIIQDITSENRFTKMEIHTIAIGDYTADRTLVMFMQTLAKQNNGDFVGVSR